MPTLFDSLQVFHASYVLQVSSQRVEQAQVPMRNFVIGRMGFRVRSSSPRDLSEALPDSPTVLPPPDEAPGLSPHLDSRKFYCQVSPLRPLTPNCREQNSSYMHRSAKAKTPIGPGQRSILVGSLAPHDTIEKQKRDSASVPSQNRSLVPAEVSPSKDCPMIDLIGLVREKQKAGNPQKKKSPLLILREEPPRYPNPQGSSFR